MEKRLRSSLHTSAQEFLSSATKLSLKSSKSTLKTLIHSIKPSSELSASLPPSLCDSIINSAQSFRRLLHQNSTSLSPAKSPRSPPTKRPRRSSRQSKTRSEPDAGANVSNIEEKKQSLLEKLQTLAHIVQLCVLHPQNAFSPPDLLPGIQALHDNLVVFESDPVLSSAIECLCEEWWKDDLPGKESLISQSLPFLLSRSLTLKKKVDVHRVYMLREAFGLFDFEDESIVDLKLLLMRCIISPLFLKTEDGRRFLAFIFGLSNQLAKELLAMIRSQIPFGRKSMLEAYGDVLFRAWKTAEGGSKSEIEDGFLQDLIESAIHASSGAFASHIRRVLGGFINQRTIDGVEKLLFRLAEPVIFRSLQVANSNVRQNALHLLLGMFPLEDPDATKEEKDALLDKQFFLLERLLTDDCPEVRTIAVEGSCRILHLFWEIIPSPTITKILTKVFDDMSHDVCSEVRLSTLNGIIFLLGNSQSHEILKVLLPRLQHLVLDNVLTVRVAAADLLIYLNDVRNFQFNKVVELDVVLSVLASDQSSVAQKITKLLIPTYFPSKLSIEEACNRCVTLVRRSPKAGARFCKFAISEGASRKHLVELFKIFISLILSPDKLDAHQIEGFLAAAGYLCDDLVSESSYRNALKELLAGENVKALLATASTGQAQSSLFNIVSTVCPDDVDKVLDKCMVVITDCHGLPEGDDHQAELRSAHKLLLSSGGFDDMLEVFGALLHKTAYRCHVKFGTDMPSHGVSLTKAKKSKSSGKSSIKSKVINRKQSFVDDYSIAVGIAWQIRDLLLHEETRKATLRSQTLEMSFLALKMISEASIVHCGNYEFIDTYPVLAYMALALQMTLHNVYTSSTRNNDAKKTSKAESSTPHSETILERTTDHVFNCLEKLLGVADPMQNEKTDSDNLLSTTKAAKNPTRRRRLSPTGDSNSSNEGSVHCEPEGAICKMKMLTAILKFMADATAMCSAPHNHGLFINYTSRSVQQVILLLEQLYRNQIKFKEEDLKDTILCLKSSSSYAAKLLNLILTDSCEFSTAPPKAFDLANDLLDLITTIESYLGSGYASRLVSAAKPWLPDLVLALSSHNILKHAGDDEEHSTPSDKMKFHFPRWPSIVAKSELSEMNEVRNEEDDNCSQAGKFSAFNRLMAMVIILLKGNSQIMDAVGVVFLSFSLSGLERKEFELSLGLLHFVCFKLFDHDDRNWGDKMLSSLQEIYPRIEREISEESHGDEHKDLHRAKELLEPLWMYHLYETGRISVTEE